MKLPRSRERDLVLSILRDDEQCVVFPQDVYRRPDGFLPVHRDGLQELLHRRLYRTMRDPAVAMRRLERICATWGCQNPFHFALRAGLAPGTRTHCPNGHVYADVGRTPTGHCVVCAAQRAARRTKEAPSGGDLNAAKSACPAGHQYDHANTYLQPTRSGVRRKCRRCNRLASAHRREVRAA